MGKILLALAFPVVFFMGCKKDAVLHPDCANKTNELSKVRAMIAGSYRWTHTYVSSFTFNDTLTPANQGRAERCVFDKDGTVKFIENGTTRWKAHYAVDYAFKVTRYPQDSATVVIISDLRTGQRKDFFFPYLCDDSASFSSMSSISTVKVYKRN